jgi:hypothetical protein
MSARAAPHVGPSDKTGRKYANGGAASKTDAKLLLLLERTSGSDSPYSLTSTTQPLASQLANRVI